MEGTFLEEHGISPLYSPSIAWMFLKLHTFHSLHMQYIWYKFGCDQSIMEGIFIEEHDISPLYSPSIAWTFPKLHTFHSLHMRYNWYYFGCNRSITKGTLLVEQVLSPLYLVLYSTNLSETSHLSLTVLVLQLFLVLLQWVHNEGHIT
jgi:hypothetical protein